MQTIISSRSRKPSRLLGLANAWMGDHYHSYEWLQGARQMKHFVVLHYAPPAFTDPRCAAWWNTAKHPPRCGEGRGGGGSFIQQSIDWHNGGTCTCWEYSRANAFVLWRMLKIQCAVYHARRGLGWGECRGSVGGA